MDTIINKTKTTARITGICYLMLAITGVLGFMVFHPKIFVLGKPQGTLSNLIEFQSTARIRLLFEFGIVVSQALAAVYFYKLFKPFDKWSAWVLGVFGVVNAIAILFSAICMAVAISIANSSNLNAENQIILIELLQSLIANSWGVGGLFFGLWLFPMGYIVVKYKCMPIWLGRTILLGGIGYLISTIISYSGIEFAYNRILILPATIGEFWMIGYLLIFGIRTSKR